MSSPESPGYKRALAAEGVRYLAVGALNTVVGYSVFAVSVLLFSAPLAAVTGWPDRVVAITIQWSVWAVAVVYSTLMMKYLVFRSQGNALHELGRGYLVYLPLQLMSSGLLWGSMTALATLVPALSSQARTLLGQAVSVLVATIFGYIAHKYFTFRGGTPSA